METLEKELAEASEKLAAAEGRFKEIHTQLVDTRIKKDDLQKMVDYYKNEKIPELKAYIEELEGGKKED